MEFQRIKTWLKKNKMIIEQLKNTPEELVFSNVITYIDEHYEFTPTKFTNGNTVNEANQNNGSCKVFSFAKITNFLQKRRFYYLASFTEKTFWKIQKEQTTKTSEISWNFAGKELFSKEKL